MLNKEKTGKGGRTVLEQAVRYFTQEGRSLSCMSIACGTENSVLRAMGGEIDLFGRPVREDSIFDLASLSKLFTGLTAMRLRAAGKLDFDAPVTHYAPQFKNLNCVTVAQTLGFEVALHTLERIDAQPDAKSAETVLFACTPHPNGENRAYSDIHAMVARYILEGASGSSLMECVRQEILVPLGMTETWCSVPQSFRERCVSCDREHRIEGNRWTVREGILPGTCHDPKARAMSPDGRDFCGHAGLFATAGDMIRLCQGILREDILSIEDLAEMARNRTGFRKKDGGWTQHLGLLCYVKHPVQYHSEVPVYMGDKALALSGFAGNHLAIDPERGIFEFYLGSRVLNRLTVLVPEEGKSLADYGLAPDGTGCVDWPGEGKVISSVDFVHLKDRHYHTAVAEALGLDA